MKQNFEAMPRELLDAPRWFKVKENKQPLTPGWNNPANQKFYNEVDGTAGFDCSGHGVGDDYCLLDFDHIFYGDGKLKEPVDKHGILDHVHALGWYIEKSISGRGAHVLIKPTPGKFGKITKKEGLGVLHFGQGAKLEIFYLSTRYCLVTGNKLETSGNKIPSGKFADNLLESLLNEIRRAYVDNKGKRTERIVHPSGDVTPKQAPMAAKRSFTADAPEYEAYRVRHMIDCVPIADLHGDDWLAVMTACKNFGMTYAEFDALNIGGETYNEEENRRRWDSVTASGDWLGALHNAAKQHGYSEADTLKAWRRANPSIAAQVAKTKADGGKLTDADLKILLSGGGSDTDNADRLAYMFHDELKFCKDDGTWFVLEGNEHGGSVWNRYDRKDAVYPHVRKLSDTLLANAVQIPNTIDGFKVVPAKGKKGAEYSLEPKEKVDDAGAVIDLAASKSALEKLGAIVKEHTRQVAIGNKLRSARNVAAAIEILKGDESIRITQDDLNRHTNLLNCLNGVVDLQAGRLYESRDFLPTNQVNAVFDTLCDSAFVENFFHEVLPDDETCAAVLRYLGFCLTGDKSFHISEFWSGEGANGKSTILDLLIKVFNTYATKLPNLALVQSNRPLDANAATPALALLGGDVRLAIVDELPRSVRLNGELFKTISGDATVRARFLFRNLETIQLRAKLILNGNHLPQFDIDDGGMRRRINNVNFTETFTGDRADPCLPKKLASDENRAALLKILVRQATQFYTDGLLESSDMKAAKKNYLDENDFVQDFADSYLIFGNGGKVSRKTLEEKIRLAFPELPLTKKEVFNLLKEKLEALGAEYTKEHNANVFKNVMLAAE